MSESKLEHPAEAGPPAGRLVAVGQSMPAARAPYGPVPADAEGSSGGEGELAYFLRTYWRIVTKRKWLIASIALAAVALNATRTLMMTPLYSASTRIQIDREAPNIIDKGKITYADVWDTNFIKTQLELLQSRAIAERAASKLNLAEDSDFFRPRNESLTTRTRNGVASLFSSPANPSRSKPSKSDLERAAAGIIQGNVAVRPVGASSIVDISYSDPNPERAQRVVMAYVESFIDSTIDKRFEANAYAKTFLDNQLKQLKLRLEESEKTLLDFAEKEQIVTVTEKSSISDNNLAAANAALGGLISDRIKNENLWRQVEGTSEINLPQLLTNSVIEGLRARRGALVTEYEEKLQTFKPSYPDMVQISNKIKETDRQLAAEVKTIRESLKGAYESALAQENEMKLRIAALKSDVIDLQKRSVQYNILKREVDTNRDLYNGLLQRYKEVDVAGGVQANNVFIVERAEVPGGPSSPNLSRALMLALCFGLGSGFALAYVLEHLDETIHGPEEMEEALGLATLGVIPMAATDVRAEGELSNPRSTLSEAYRSLCTSLQFATEAGLPKTIVVTSSGPGEGKSLTSVALARHFATMGLKVLLIDADLRNSSLHKKLDLDNTTGLTNYLTGACRPPEAFQKTTLPTLAFMSSGPLPPNAAELLAGSRMVSLLTTGLEVFDLIIVDGPPVMGLADAAILSNTAQATVFVVGAGQAKTSLVRGALRRLHLARAPIIGAVLTKFDAKSAGYGYGPGYGYEYAYGYGYGQATPDRAPPALHGSGRRAEAQIVRAAE
jgi:capsular exopolysaccharide synthesis family protein